MNIDVISPQIHFKERETLIKALLILKLMEKNIKVTDNELGILAVIAQNSQKSQIISAAIERGYVKSHQSGENFISKMVNMGLVDKVSSGVRKVNSEFIPDLKSEFIAATVKIHNIATN